MPYTVFAGAGEWTGAPDSAPTHGLYGFDPGAKAWLRLDGGLPEDIEVRDFAVHPTRPGVIFAGSHLGPLRSTDVGMTWQMLPLPETSTAEERVVWSINVHPTRPNTVLAGTQGSAVFRSDDGGDSWQRLDALVPPGAVSMGFPMRVVDIAFDAASPDDIYVAYEVGGLVCSRDNGASWQSCNRHPLSKGMGPIQGSMIPRQGDGLPLDPTGIGGDLSNPAKNAAAIKTLGYFMGADFVGICRAEPWMFYSHDGQGNEIDVYHKYVVVMLIDQGHETMEGASGDDWISGSQSMRGYMRGAEIAGIMASHCRRMGYSSRAHTNSDSQILHNPAILMSGLGEISRIGDTMLNPFIGPRSKSVLFSTDLPLTIDLPIDAGVQQFCESCSKCARECPCNAIPFGPKVMFNGYETWRMDAVKCTSYRITNEKGSFCGRCMKMCPWNTEGLATHRAVMWLARKFPMTHGWIARMDDKLLNGSRNLVKRWWFDLDVVDGVCVTPGATNERDLNLDNAARKDVQKLSLIPPEMWPSPDETTAHPIDRAAAIRFYEEAELPEQARRRSRQKSGAGLT